LQTVQRVSKGGRVGGSDETSLPDRLRGILIGLGIIGLLVAVYLTTMKGFGRTLFW
jgi:type II secretory pathway component PulM